jgi:hypothetical protein
MQDELETTENVIDYCVDAGLAVRLADREAIVLRAKRAKQRSLGLVERTRLNSLEAEISKLSWAFVACKNRLREASPSLYDQHLAEVDRQIEELLRHAAEP